MRAISCRLRSNRQDPDALARVLGGAKKLVVASDVANTKMLARFAREDGAVVRLVKWTSPPRHADCSPAGSSAVKALMEPSGTYGDRPEALPDVGRHNRTPLVLLARYPGPAALADN